MENALRPESAPVIETLNRASIRTVMVTGENHYVLLNSMRVEGAKLVCPFVGH